LLRLGNELVAILGVKVELLGSRPELQEQKGKKEIRACKGLTELERLRRA